MNSFVHALNHLGAHLTGFAFSMLVQSSLLIIALFLLDLALRKRVRAVVRYPLWILVLVKLVLPPSLAAPTGLAYWLPERKIVKTSPIVTPPVAVHYSETGIVEPLVLHPLPPPRPRLEAAAKFLLAWLVIALGLMAWLVRRSHSVARTAAHATAASNSPEELLEACGQQMGIRQRVGVKISANAGSPAVCGLCRPVILIPQVLADELTPLQLRAVLFHELAHIQRGDVWANYAQTLLQIFYWWHPLLWLANARIRRVREQAVDERVMVEMGREAEAYPNTLLEVAKLASRHPVPALGLIGIVESKSALAQRIRHLLDNPAPKSAKLGFVRLTAVALLGAALLPMARGQRPAQPNPGVNARPDIVNMTVKFVELTDPALEAVSLGNPTVTSPNGHQAWVLPPEDDLIARLQGQPGTSILFAPSVTTHSGQQAQISVTQPQDFNRHVIEVGPVCELLPEVSGDWIDLAVIAKVTEFGEIVSDQLNGLQLRPKQSDSSGKSEEGAVRSVNATGYIIHDAGTARVSVVNAGFVVLQNPEVKSMNGKRILVVVSPRIVREPASASTLDPNAVSLAGSSSSGARPREETRVLAPATAKSAQAQPPGAPTKDNTSARGPENLTVTIAKLEPYFYFSYPTLDTKPVSLEQLQAEFKRAARMNPAVALSIRGDNDAPLGLIVKVKDAAKEAGIKSISVASGPQETNPPSVFDTNLGERFGKPSPSEAAPSNSVPVLGDLPFVGRLFRSQSALASPGRGTIQAKLNRIVLPEIGFDNVRLPEAIQQLAKEARDRDPDRTGVNFLLNPNVIGMPQEAIDPNTGNWLPLPRPEPLDMNTVRVRINPPLRNVRLGEAIEALVHTADKPIRYSIEDYAVIFSQKLPGSKRLETRTFRVDPTTFFEDAHRFLFEAGWSDIDIFGQSNDWRLSIIRKLCESLEVSHLPPNTIFYTYGTSMLMVRATADELDRVQKAIESLNALRQKEFANQSPATSAKVGEVKVSRPNATEELVVAITAQYIYLGPQPLTLEMLKTKLAEAKGRNPNLRLVVKADQDAPVEQVGAMLAMARSLNIEPFSAKSSESDTKQLGFDWFLGNTLLSNGRMGIQGGTAPSFLGTPSLANPTGTIKLEPRVFRVNPATLLEGLKNASGVPPGSGTIDDPRRINNSIQDSIREFFTAAGVNVQPPNALFYNDRIGVLMVRATAKELDLVEKVLETLNYRPPQVTVEARFIEMPTETASELGLDLPPPDDRTSNTWTRILTAAQTRALLHAAERHLGVDILSAPKITTLSGRQAQIQAVEARTVVTGIDPKALAPPGVQATKSDPAQPYLTSQVPCGPALDVVPTVGGDGYTIRLAALPQVTEFLRYDTTLNGAKERRVWVNGKQQNVPLPLLVIRIRQMQASVDVYDGQTLVLSAARVTQVLQQSNGQSVTNAIPEDPGKRLLVFITPTIIDPAGNPIHASGNAPWADKTPPQPR